MVKYIKVGGLYVKVLFINNIECIFMCQIFKNVKKNY